MKQESGEYDPRNSQFTMGIFNIDSGKKLRQLVVSVFAPWWYMGKVAAKLYRGKRFVYMFVIGTLFYLWVVLMAVELNMQGMSYVAWSVFCMFIAYATGIRINLRSKFNIDGNMAEDFFAVMLLYPLSAVQMYHQIQNGKMRYSCEDECHEMPKSGEAAEEFLLQDKNKASNYPDVESCANGQ